MWDATTGELTSEIEAHSRAVRKIVVLDDARVASGGDDGVVCIWSIPDGTRIHRLSGHQGPTEALAVLPGRRLASGSDDRKIKIWDVDTGEEVRELREPEQRVRALAVLDDGSLVSAGNAGTVRIWDLESGTQVRELHNANRQIRALANLAGGKLAAAGSSGTIGIWNVSTGDLLHELRGHQDWVNALVLLHDGRIASSSDDQTIRIWDVDTGQALDVVNGHHDWVNALAVLPDGTLASGGNDNTIRLWKVNAGHSVIPLSTTSGGATNDATRTDTLPDEPSATDGLGQERDVQRLANVIVSTTAQPPLAIALLGEWGSGKSSFMRQLEQRIRALCATPHEPTNAFVTQVAHVRFNPWHYSDDSVLLGMVTEVYRALAEQIAPDEPSVPAEHSNDAERDARAEVSLAHTQYDEANQLIQRLVATNHSGLFTRTVKRLWIGMVAGWRFARWRSLSAAAAVIALFIAGEALVLRFVPESLTALAIPGGLMAAVATTAGVFDKRRSGPNASSALSSLLTDRLMTARSDAEERLSASTANLARFDALSGLRTVIDDPEHAAARQGHRGVTGTLHEQLMQLATAVEQVRRSREKVDQPNVPDPFVERIILYVDDVDRCAPERIMEVLRAVNLLASTHLFVVVVGVDPQWLQSAVERHHEVLATGLGQAAGDAGIGPHEYLEKIFQIPFHLRQPSAHDYSSFLVQLIDDAHLHEVEQTGATNAAMETAGRSRATAQSPTLVAGPTTSPSSETSVSPRANSSDAVDPTPRRQPTEPAAAQQTAAPVRLRITTAERDFLAEATALIPTPRGVKKLLNLYVLLRSGITPPRLEHYLSERDYQRVIILLALVVGAPAQAADVLDALAGPDHQPLRAVVRSAVQHHEPGAAAGACPLCSKSESFALTLESVLDRHPELDAPNAYAGDAGGVPLLSEVARYSFHTLGLRLLA